eukprot:TRINITY_DN3790_c0_g2_i1.p1 TRINITY_DN3790_c0_g2~~TRINITY_DN3790_c0_g2_i1.p1  ORF type:complete len:214 (+),score=24.83 TRINITY_DN3790_c0_g2_i1:156-797(+)
MDENVPYLPAEIVYVVFSSLDFFSLVTVSTVSHTWNEQSIYTRKRMSENLVGLKKRWEDKTSSYKQSVQTLALSILNVYDGLETGTLSLIQARSKQLFDNVIGKLHCTDINESLSTAQNMVLYSYSPILKYSQGAPERKCASVLYDYLSSAETFSRGKDLKDIDQNPFIEIKEQQNISRLLLEIKSTIEKMFGCAPRWVPALPHAHQSKYQTM